MSADLHTTTLLAEYSQLKAEQTQRIAFRDNLLRSALITIGGVFTIGGNVKFGHEIFLIIPWLTFILGWVYLINDEKISSIGYYIKTTLSKQLETTLNKAAVGTYWLISPHQHGESSSA